MRFLFLNKPTSVQLIVPEFKVFAVQSRDHIGFGLLRDLQDLAELKSELNQSLQHALPLLVDVGRLVVLEVDADGHAH
jgi:hypothetical protein